MLMNRFLINIFSCATNSESECPTRKRHYDYFAILIASRLKNSLQDACVIYPKAKEGRSELDLHKKSFDGFEMIINIIKHSVPRLGHNALACDPATLVNSLKASSSGSYKSFHSKAQEIEDTVNCLKEDYGPRGLILRYL